MPRCRWCARSRRTWCALSREVIERRERLALLTAGRQNRAARSPTARSCRRSKKSWRKTASPLQDYVEELRDLGVEPKSGPKGWSIFRR